MSASDAFSLPESFVDGVASVAYERLSVVVSDKLEDSCNVRSRLALHRNMGVGEEKSHLLF